MFSATSGVAQDAGPSPRILPPACNGAGTAVALVSTTGGEVTNLSLVTLAADDELFDSAVESRFLLGSELAAGFDGLGDRAWGEDVATLREAGEAQDLPYGDEGDENTVMTMS